MVRELLQERGQLSSFRLGRIEDHDQSLLIGEDESAAVPVNEPQPRGETRISEIIRIENVSRNCFRQDPGIEDVCLAETKPSTDSSGDALETPLVLIAATVVRHLSPPADRTCTTAPADIRQTKHLLESGRVVWRQVPVCPEVESNWLWRRLRLGFM